MTEDQRIQVASTRPGLAWRTARAMLFALDAEFTHRSTMGMLSALEGFFPSRISQRHPGRMPGLSKNLMGLTFKNPLGLAAGFDKDAEAVPAFQSMGFGFVELGTVTAQPQPGNPRPRLFRLTADGALMNRMGFNNHGARTLAERVGRLRQKNKIDTVVGINIGKSKVVPLEEAENDYLRSFRAVADVADYVAVNVSSPNTPGLRDLQAEDTLARLLDALAAENARRQTPRPLLLKLAPDLSGEGAQICADVAVARGLAGLIVTNTTISREGLKGPIPEGTGGISGRPLFARSTAMLRELKESHGGKLVLVGVGGIMDGHGAVEKLRAGADLIQVYTGLIYGGPLFPRRMFKAIADADGRGLLSSST